MPATSTIPVRIASFAELGAAELYALLRLRTDVFVVEQECAYPELDGRDTEPGTLHAWIADPEDPRTPLACLRVLDEPDGSARIGRVATAPAARGRGLARLLLAAALERVGDREVRLDAQAYATGLYRSFGFAVCGPEFTEDGIAHVPMVRSSSAAE
ncbi:GNAT family N-acetyltransferase [Nocardiopsis composta]|uniref:ElaA protein n=1 Tax=Nocardiopsis composta TaxID=157465 RepID=A0A7W8VE82_9ACTN|nr:GNAT family N-acetyltransferase [Nocardiopsis composta]MBB5432669.1 ElaA protein [Nocardiopsis composta]